MKKTIYINGRFLTQNITGVQRYAKELVKAIDQQMMNQVYEDIKFIILTPKDVLHSVELKNIQIKQVGFLIGHVWEQVELPFYAKGGLLMNLCNTGPFLKHHQIVTIHDAAVYAYPRQFSKMFLMWYRVLFPTLGRIGKRIITVSHFSQKELVRYCKLNQNKFKVVYNGHEHLLSIQSEEEILGKHDLLEKPYVLAVSSMNPNKNFQAIVQASQIIRNQTFEIVIVGGTNPKVFANKGAKLSENVKYVGRVTDGELRSLYEHAACFVYPSFYEGFGLPPIEAMACGCPVIVSNVASLPEVCGDAAIYCDPYDPADIADKIQQLINDPGLRDTLKKKGRERAKLFTWEKCASETIAVIDEVLKK